MPISDDPGAPAGRIDGMVRVLRGYGIDDESVIGAMSRVPRHLFIPRDHRADCDPYGDHPCPIGHGQTISQPFIVAYMVSGLGILPGMRVLEVGIGCGYQAAVLVELGVQVYGMDIIAELAEGADRTLASLGYSGFRVRTGDGFAGWPDEAPFDRIIVSCAPDRVPDALVEQLADPGLMILPVGFSWEQRLVRVRKQQGRLTFIEDLPVRFVPMVSGRGVETE